MSDRATSGLKAVCGFANGAKCDLLPSYERTQHLGSLGRRPHVRLGRVASRRLRGQHEHRAPGVREQRDIDTKQRDIDTDADGGSGRRRRRLVGETDAVSTLSGDAEAASPKHQDVFAT